MSDSSSVQLLVLKSLAHNRQAALQELNTYLRTGFEHPQWTLQHKEAWIAFNHLLGNLPNEIGPHLIGYSLTDGAQPDEVLLMVRDNQSKILASPTDAYPVEHPPQCAEVTIRPALLEESRQARTLVQDLDDISTRIDAYLDQWKPKDKEDIRPVVSCLPAFVLRVYCEIFYDYKVIAFVAEDRDSDTERALRMTLCNGKKTIQFTYYHEVAVGEFIGLMKRIHG